MKCIPLIDNRSHAINDLKYFETEETISEEDINSLEKISHRTIKNIIENDNLLIFPSDLNKSKDIDKSKTIFNIYNDKILTNNLMGFIGYNDTQIKITSRFASNENDYFLHYMLQKVLCLNIFDLQHSTNKDDSFDFLIYMFLDLFQKAIRQGIFKSYQKRKYNDANVRGVIDINRHIKNNIPFNGKIAYNTREYSYDNNITQLIRHTIEYINTKSRGILNINEDIKSGVFQIIEATKRYDKNKRQSIINKNLKKLNHPYFYEYEPLRKICIQILRHEELKYGREENKIYGILFDGAYLWEEYIWTILKDLNFKHPENKTGKGGINLLEKDWEVFPDFYKINNEKNIVLDTKYKRLENKDIDRNDKHQIISYVYTLGAKIGGFVYPSENKEFSFDNIGILNREYNKNILEDYSPSIFKYAFLIPNKKSNKENFENINDFKKEIEKSENDFKEKIKNEFQ
ncbi:restriction endonuclease [Brachyspira aalborgi]|uniref:Restriction endonuclease n=1 Tax=Brachyspira aalborgi TaxID=29522 RepID=A0A5C8D898_9SPIR|nr:restriction endonuclease [Brachyspira aalborgi]TXJ20691.1 restriction endonuclease [Brachyspira aalborgi]